MNIRHDVARQRPTCRMWRADVADVADAAHAADAADAATDPLIRSRNDPVWRLPAARSAHAGAGTRK
jgi:hypothetical protein